MQLTVGEVGGSLRWWVSPRRSLLTGHLLASIENDGSGASEPRRTCKC
jgi:hypothetical protein